MDIVFLRTGHTIKELQKIIEYPGENQSLKEPGNLALNIEKIYHSISNKQLLFQTSEIKKDDRNTVVLKLNSLY